MRLLRLPARFSARLLAMTHPIRPAGHVPKLSFALLVTLRSSLPCACPVLSVKQAVYNYLSSFPGSAEKAKLSFARKKGVVRRLPPAERVLTRFPNAAPNHTALCRSTFALLAAAPASFTGKLLQLYRLEIIQVQRAVKSQRRPHILKSNHGCFCQCSLGLVSKSFHLIV